MLYLYLIIWFKCVESSFIIYIKKCFVPDAIKTDVWMWRAKKETWPLPRGGGNIFWIYVLRICQQNERI